MAKRRSSRRGIGPVADLTVDHLNANLGTPRGRDALERSLREYGPGRSVLIVRHGQIIAGNKTFEQATALNIPVKIVQTDGTHLVAVQRADLDLERDSRARGLALADNRVGELNLEWDVEMLKKLHAALPSEKITELRFKTGTWK